ncbi:hypothetical protein BH09ACT5_BH09ACT5_03540 [soil metagenome]
MTGSYRALVESHLPVAFLDERPESLARLPEAKVLVLPDVLALTPTESAAIADFVRAGGGLVVTGQLGVRTPDGTPTVDPSLPALLGVSFGELGRFTFPYLRLTDGLSDELGDWPLPHYGRLAALEDLAPDVRVLARRTDPVLETDDTTYWHNNQPAPGAPVDDPVIVERTVGRGRVIVSAARLGNNRARLGHGAYRDLLLALVRRAAGQEPLVALEGAHHNTEVVVARRGDLVIVHLVTGYPVVSLDLFGAAQPAAIEDVARLDSLRLVVPEGTTSAARIVGGEEVPLTLDGRGLVIHAADDWETVVLRGDWPASRP